MTAITSTGIGSGLDVNTIVSQLVSAERSGADSRLSAAQSKANTQISALGSFKSVLSSLQATAKSLSGSTSSFGQLTATSADNTVFTASATSAAVAGSYNVEVLSTASPSKLSSNLFSGSTAVVGAGAVTIGVGSDAFTVTLTDPTSSLANLRDAINTASDNTGVGAAIVSDSGGARLLLTSRETGTANALSVTSGLLTTTSVQTATDASIKLDGFSYTSSSNQVTGAIDGLTINLAKAVPGSTTRLDVALNQSSAISAVQSFVTAYNTASSFMSTATAYNATTKTGGPLLGDVTVLSAQQQLRGILGGSLGSGTYRTLAEIGITSAVDGTLSVDSAKLTAAIGNDFSAVSRLFGGSDGVAAKVAAVTSGLVDSTGVIAAETSGLNSQLKLISTQQTDLNTRMTAFEARTRAQYVALDTLMSQMKSTSDYLTQQLANLNGSNLNSNK